MASVQALPASHKPSIPIPPAQAPLTGLPQTPSHTVNSSPKLSQIPRGPVDAILSFYDPPKDGAAPFNYVEQPPEGVPQRNFGGFDHQVHLQDARGHESDFTLDEHAFAALQNHPHNPTIDWQSEDSVKEHYYPEVEQIILKNVPGAKRVLIFDHTIRRQGSNREPVTRAHIDQTSKSAKQRVEFHLPDEAETLLKGRYRILNVWRPLNGAVETFPLAFADSSTVPDGDMVGVEHRYPDRTGETAGVRYNPDHKWWYWSGIDNDERILLQCFDSAAPSTRVPHTAFKDPRSTEHNKGRESIEVRTLVFG